MTCPATPPVRFDDKDDTSWSPISVDANVVPGRTGTEVQPEQVAPELSRAVREAERELALPLAEYPADFSTEEATEQVPTHLLSTFTTYHACCQTRVAQHPAAGRPRRRARWSCRASSSASTRSRACASAARGSSPPG